MFRVGDRVVHIKHPEIGSGVIEYVGMDGSWYSVVWESRYLVPLVPFNVLQHDNSMPDDWKHGIEDAYSIMFADQALHTAINDEVWEEVAPRG